MVYIVAVHSLPSIQQRTEENWKITHREANIESSLNSNTSEAAQLQAELGNLSIPGYLKDLYINLTYLNGEARPSSNHKHTKINTVQSYKKQATSKLNY